VRTLAITGWSDSGKTTLIVELIEHFVARGERVAAIKHTHHEVNDRDEGDTARFRAAGASPVILAGDGVASGGITFGDPRELLAHAGDADVLLIEGFKSYDGWPRIDAAAGLAEALAILDRIAGP